MAPHQNIERNTTSNNNPSQAVGNANLCNRLVELRAYMRLIRLMTSQKYSKMSARHSVGQRGSHHSTQLFFLSFFLSSMRLFGTDNVVLAFHVGRPSPSRLDFSLNIRRVKKGSTSAGMETNEASEFIHKHEETSRLSKKEKGFQTISSKNKSNKLIEYAQGTMDTALCLVPPDEAWDDIQRGKCVGNIYLYNT